MSSNDRAIEAETVSGEAVMPDAGCERSTAMAVVPAMSLERALELRDTFQAFMTKLMIPGQDYDRIPGAGSKPVLLKGGGEKLAVFFGLSPEFEIVQHIEQWDAPEMFFTYTIRCRLRRDGIVRGEGLGSCNSRESKYRWRMAERKCPICGKAAIIRNKFDGGWLCFSKKGGCGAKYQEGDPRIERQETGRVLNPDLADQANVILKMARKRAFLDAVLSAVAASQFFTQDVEDLYPHEPAGHGVGNPEAPEPGESREVKRTAARRKSSSPSASTSPSSSSSPRSASSHSLSPADTDQEPPWDNFAGMVVEFSKLHGRLALPDDHLYQEILARHGVKHSNQFKSREVAAAAYRELRGKVEELAAAAEKDGITAEDCESRTGPELEQDLFGELPHAG